MNNLTIQQKVIVINNFESDVPGNAKKVCLLSNKDKQRGKYNTKYTKIAITQAKIDRQIDVISNSCGNLSIDAIVEKRESLERNVKKKSAFFDKHKRK